MRGVVDGFKQLIFTGFERTVQAVAVGRLDENHVGLLNRLRVLNDQLVVTPDVA